MELFRELNSEEIKKFEAWAEAHQDKASIEKEGVYHPVVIEYWIKLGLIERGD